MAEYVMKDLVRKAGLESDFEITSGAVSDEEWGNPIYPPAQRKLREKGVAFGHHSAHKISHTEFDAQDLVVVMDHSNLRWLSRIVPDHANVPAGQSVLGADVSANAGASPAGAETSDHAGSSLAGAGTCDHAGASPAGAGTSDHAGLGLAGAGISKKVHLMMSFVGEDRDVADPWYTGDFEKTYQDVLAGCSALLEMLK